MRVIFSISQAIGLSLLFAAASFAQQARPLQFQEVIHDFGYVDQNGGPVTYSFQFANISERPVRILSVQASCGCTTPDWTRDPVSPGKGGFIQASYDPKGRPGYFNKSLTVTTDADPNPFILQIKGQVSVGSQLAAVSEFRSSMGSWKLKTTSFNLGKVHRKDEFTVREFPVYNGGDRPVTFLKMEGPSYIQAEVIPATIAPQGQGKIRVLYNGAQRDAYGFQSDRIDIHTDDADMPLKSITVYATLEDYFPVMSREELQKAPLLRIVGSPFDLGKIGQFKDARQVITLRNDGKSKLTINAIQPNCRCISTALAASEIRPGEEATLEIVFNPEDRLCTQQKSVMIYSNDPQNPAQRITFNAYVEK
ncbi:MAG: DUF1573 domain-containing protein [Cyclobacteriaceae bacterium]|nr:DUF1573 domain-containing protein [Cyclobacteriaceae bacterium]